MFGFGREKLNRTRAEVLVLLHGFLSTSYNVGMRLGQTLLFLIQFLFVKLFFKFGSVYRVHYKTLISYCH